SSSPSRNYILSMRPILKFAIAPTAVNWSRFKAEVVSVFNARTYSLAFSLAAALAAGTVPVRPALAWSPLQYDTKQEVNTGHTSHTIYQELMGRVKQDMESAQSDVQGDQPPGAPSEKSLSGQLNDREAQSAIEGDAASDNVAGEEWGPSDHQEAVPVP